MTYIELGTAHKIINRMGPKRYPEMYTAFLRLEPNDRDVVVREARHISNIMSNMGLMSAMELLYKLGRFLNGR